MTKYKFGDIVFVSFLQSDGSIKKRPALVILDTGDDDIVLASVTTNERKGKGDCKILNYQQAGLLLDSWVRLAKIAYLHKNNLGTKLGELKSEDKINIIKVWNKLYKF